MGRGEKVEEILEDVIKKIKAKLKEKGMTQKDFSLKMGKGKDWFTVLPHAQRDIKVKDLIRACEILGTEPSFLLGGNFSTNICNMRMEDLIRILVKRECDDYLDEKLGNASDLLKHIRDKNDE